MAVQKATKQCWMKRLELSPLSYDSTPCKRGKMYLLTIEAMRAWTSQCQLDSVGCLNIW